MFYPQLVAGPIERPENLIHQLAEEHSFDAQRVLDGLKLMVWGFFKKMVIADKIAIVVDRVYEHPTDFTGVPLIAAALFFGIQVYCDFSGYSDIAIGSAQVMGIRLRDNFNRPFHSTSIADFWRRWHISLVAWFRDYVYIPLGGNRVGKGRWYFNLFFTFTLSGLWHGAGWGFVLWGSLNGCYLILSDLTRTLRKKWVQWIRLDRLPKLHRGLQMTFTFLLFCFTLIIFRAKSLSDALYAITHLGTGLSSRAGIKMSFERLYSLGLDRYGLLIAVLSIAIMELIYGIEKQSQMRQMFSEKPVWVRWPLYYLLILFLIFFGEYNDHAFIYFQF
jgi:D-alanyl-lipoteichoic acid acyltransferase DltB (MBOAT superfamily)